ERLDQNKQCLRRGQPRLGYFISNVCRDTLEPLRPSAMRHLAEHAMSYGVGTVLVADVEIGFFALTTLVVQQLIELQKGFRLRAKRAHDPILKVLDTAANCTVKQPYFDCAVNWMRFHVGPAKLLVVAPAGRLSMRHVGGMTALVSSLQRHFSACA